MFDWLLAFVVNDGLHRKEPRVSKAWTERELEELADSNPRIAEQLRAEGALAPEPEPYVIPTFTVRQIGEWVPQSVNPPLKPTTNTPLFLFGWTVVVLGWTVEQIAKVLQFAGTMLEVVGGWIRDGGRAMRNHAEHKVD